jgi:hypothetical protein
MTVAEVRSVMLADGHELVVFGHVQRFAHRAVKAVEDRLPVSFRLSGAQRDANDGHRRVLLHSVRTGKARRPHRRFTSLTKSAIKPS